MRHGDAMSSAETLPGIVLLLFHIESQTLSIQRSTFIADRSFRKLSGRQEFL
jgi:hypothetical protein